jgi:hypothetical protein
MCSTTIWSGLMSGSLRNAAIASSRVIVGTVPAVVCGGGCSGTRDLAGGMRGSSGRYARGPCVLDAIIRATGSPAFLPRYGRGGRRGRDVGQSKRSVFDLCGVQECLALLKFYVQNGRADQATRYLFGVRFAGPVVGRGSLGHVLGCLSRSVDGGAVGAEPDG